MSFLHYPAILALVLATAATIEGAAIARSSSTPGGLGASPLSSDDPLLTALNAASPPQPEVIVLSESDLLFDDIQIASLTQSSFQGTITEDELLSLSNNTRSATSSQQQQRGVIGGVDNRQLFSDTNWPFRAVDKFVAQNSAGNGWSCTGTLVGPRHMLTAGHCAMDVKSGSFMPGYDNTARFGTAYLTAIIRIDSTGEPPVCGSKRDWAIVVLDRRIGETVGYIGTIRNPRGDTFVTPGNLVTIGYPIDRDNTQRPYRMQGVRAMGEWSLQCDTTGPLATTADANGGQSGSPLWQPQSGSVDRWIIGVLSASGAETTVAAFANEMVESLARVKSQFP